MDEDKAESEDLDSTKSLEPSDSSLPKRVGPYRVLERLGEGGMGVVYLAEQTEPMRRMVALKIIKHGMDTKQVVTRFEAERQALAMMDHPCVAKVFEAGSTEGGRPYFAMEYVQGVPITKHCDRQRLTTRERLELFQQVCEGVQHAHQNAIIHRDLKPSNVLVSYRDGKATPKIIDFGVAKAIRHRLTEKTLYTEMGVLIGTPEYMSPEQAEMTGQNVDTRTDVYSLGVMLYELLVGALPFESKELRRVGFDEIRRKIREDEPSKPSARLSTLDGERATDSAKRRRTDPSSLRRQLSGDLDWITMRALEKDRARRYGSPSELAADLERHLTSQPVLASPPSAAYRARKFVRRHKVGVGVAAAAVLVLLAFAVTMTVQTRRIAAERDRVESMGRRAEEIAIEWLDLATEILGSEHTRTADALLALENIYRSRGETENALDALLRAYDMTLKAFGSFHPKTQEVLERLRESRADSSYPPSDESEMPVLHRAAVEVAIGNEDVARRILADFYTESARSWLEPSAVGRLPGEFTLGFEGSLSRAASNLRIAGYYVKELGGETEAALSFDTVRSTLVGLLPSPITDAGLAYELARISALFDDTREAVGWLRQAVDAGFLDAVRLSNDLDFDALHGNPEFEAIVAEVDEARPLVRERLAAGRKTAEKPQASALAKNRHAWDLLTCEPADLRDPKSALRFALEASELSNFENPVILDTLSLAYHLTGDTAKAIENQKKAISLLPEGQSASRTGLEEALAKFEAALKRGEE